MTNAGGIGSRSSPIIIDDDDDNNQLPIDIDTVKAQDPIPTRQGPNYSNNGIGYSILIRMGYKPGYGLGVNLEGVTSPVKARVRPQSLPVGLGARNAIRSKTVPPRNAQSLKKSVLATATSQAHVIPATSKRAHETTPSLPADKTTTPNERQPEQSLNQDPQPYPQPFSLSGIASQSVSTIPFCIDPSSRDRSNLSHGDSVRKVVTRRTRSSTSKTHQLDSLRASDATKDGANRVPLPTPNVPLPFFPIPSLVPLHLPMLPIGSQVSMPVNSPLASVDVNSRSIHPPPLPSTGISYIVNSKGKNAILGMSTDNRPGETRGSFPKQLEPPPNPSCSVVMEILPRKFRTEPFVLQWLSQFTFQPTRYKIMEGKVFFEFNSEREAHLAWNSPRMSGKGGLQGVRLFWYRDVSPSTTMEPGSNGKVKATRTVANSTKAQPQLVSDPPTTMASEGCPGPQEAHLRPHVRPYNLALYPLLSPSSAVKVEVEHQDPRVVTILPVKDAITHPNKQGSLVTPSSDKISESSSIHYPTAMPSFSVAHALSSDPIGNGTTAGDIEMKDSTSGGATDFAAASSSSSRTSPPLVPPLSPKTLDSWVTTLPFSHPVHPIPQSQELMQANQSAMDTSHSGPDVEQTRFNEASPITDNSMETVDAVALAKELALRQMVLQSRKRKVAETPSSQQPTLDTSRNSLKELAVDFIADAITRPPPAKRARFTPSASTLAAWGERLERHIRKSKFIMAKMQATRSKLERDRLLVHLREHNRLIDEEKTAFFSSPVEVAAPISPWPDSHPDGGILVLSDTEDDDDDDMTDDMDEV
ncbi:hypothetical protein B0F90DRAFT_1917073 [Multifurca ochricompacta]|uniref:G-patch domain-containing protein n=1 Tax=Multifurca ochricompacta TaxID=376703 RepID=A0AAD4M5K6_9AGAM|nr:hypothetical protein B0F90DRAFT_1917073 [Multifurca ochricompacta]